MNLNPELHLSQLSIAESCKYLDQTTGTGRSSERRCSTGPTVSKKPQDESRIIYEKDPEAGHTDNSSSDEEDHKAQGKLPTIIITKPKPKVAERKGWKRYIGLVFTIVHVIAFTLSALIVKLLHDYHPFAIAFWRFQGVFLPSVFVAVQYGSHCCCRKQEFIKSKEKSETKPMFDQLWPLNNRQNVKNAILLTLRCWTGCAALFSYFYSLKYISIADSFVIAAAGPCFVSVLAFIFLKESLGVFTICLTLTTMSGVVLISRPPFLTGAEAFDEKTLIGFTICIACTVISSTSFILLRYLRHIHFAIISSSFGAWGTVLSLVFALSFNVFQMPTTWVEVLYLLGIGVLTFIAQITITQALQTEEASVVSLLKTTNIIFAFIWQFIFLGVKPDLYSLAGATVVLLGCVGSVFRRWLSQLPENHRHTRTFWFVLK